MSKAPVSNYTGSQTTYDMVREVIRQRFGDKAAEEYDPYRNCLTFQSWLARGFKVKRGEESIQSITYIPKKDEKGEIIGKVKRIVFLFFYTQVEPEVTAAPVPPLQEKEKSDLFVPESQMASKNKMTDRQRQLISKLIVKRMPRREQSKWFEEMENFSKFEASEWLSSALLSPGR